jgi:hypothetical protein
MPPSADERLAAVMNKVKRAKDHLSHLKECVSRFRDSDPYRVAPHYNPWAKRLAYRVSRAEETLVDIPLAAGDVLQCTRTALDHLVYQLVLVGGGTPTKQTSFPIVDALKDYLGRRNVAMAGMRDEAKLAIDACKPYADQGGNLVLWRLMRLNNIDKHRTLLTAGMAHQHVRLGGGSGVTLSFTRLRSNSTKCSLVVGDEVCVFEGMRTPPQNHDHIQFAYQVALNEPGISDEQLPLVETLAETVDFTEQLIQSFGPLLA